MDNELRLALESVINVSMNDEQWGQASLPVRYGGLGVRRVQDIGLVAFLASSHGVADLVARILPFYGGGILIPYVTEALVAWAIRTVNGERPEDLTIQRGWDEIAARQSFSQLMGGAVGVDVSRLKAVSEPESAAWLHALPSPNMGTLLDNDTLRIAAALRIGCKVCEPHRCICGCWVEENGHHGLSCQRCAGRFPRHQALNDIIRRALVSVDVPCILEPPGLSRTDGKRPDGLTLIPWQRGRCLIWDATCVGTFAPSHLRQTIRVAGSAAESAARLKRTKYANLEQGYDFVPAAFETGGPWGADAKDFVREIGQRMRTKGGDPRSGAFLVQRISLAIQRGNAASVLGTFEPGLRRAVPLV